MFDIISLFIKYYFTKYSSFFKYFAYLKVKFNNIKEILNILHLDAMHIKCSAKQLKF